MHILPGVIGGNNCSKNKNIASNSCITGKSKSPDCTASSSTSEKTNFTHSKNIRKSRSNAKNNTCRNENLTIRVLLRAGSSGLLRVWWGRGLRVEGLGVRDPLGFA